MRFFVLFYFVLLSTQSLSQDCYPPFELNSVESETARLLNSRFDSSSVLIAWGYSNYWAKGEVLTVLETTSRCKIRKFKVFIPFEKPQNLKLKRKRLTMRKRNKIRDSLSLLLESQDYKLNENLLNIYEHSIEEDGVMITRSVSVSDGTNNSFYLIKAAKGFHYQTFDPLTYIIRQYPGFLERQKFLDILTMLDSIST